MSEALKNLELASLHFAPEILVLGGIGVVVAGLAVWLGGLKFTAAIAAVTAAAIGLVVCLLFVTPSPVTICAVTMIPAAISCLLQKPFAILAGALLALTVGALIGMTSTLAGTPLSPPKHPYPYESGHRVALSIPQTAAEIKSEALFWADTFRDAAGRTAPVEFAAGAIAAVLLIGGGFLMPRQATAFACASLGTAMICVGMTLVLLYKGARPLTHLYSRGGFYGTVALAMIAFGAFTQLVLCPAKGKKKGGKKEKSGEE